MKRERIIIHRVATTLVAMLFMGAFFIRCASIGSPSGGPRDSLPPVIVAMNPDNFTTNIDTMARKIYIEFDEFVAITDQQKEFFTSPKMKNTPQLQTRGRGVVVTLRDTLMANTTYALNFGTSIRDNNEGNPLYSMRYVFSTGDEIDSMIMSGYVEDCYDADSVSGAFVMLFPVDSVDMTAEYDSTLFNSTPAVIARAEANGIFIAQNIKPIPYHIYAIEDTNNNFTYEPGTDKVGFIEGTYNPAEMEEFAVWLDTLRKYVVAQPQLHFRTFLDAPFRRQLLVDKERPIQHQAKLYFGANYPQIDSIIFDSLSSDQVMVEYLTKGKDTLSLWFNAPAEMIPDTLRGRVVYYKHDSVSVLQRVTEPLTLSWRYIESKEMRQEREKQEREQKRAEENGEEWKAPEEENPFEVMMSKEKTFNPEKSLTFDFKYPIAKIDTTAITLRGLSPEAVKLRNEMLAQQAGSDSAQGEISRGVSQPYSLTRDTMDMRRWHLRADWGDEGSEYFLSIPAGAITDIAGFKNDSITQEYTPQLRSNFATVVVNMGIDEAQPSHYILELMDGSGTKIVERKVGIEQSSSVQFNYVPAGNVTLRVIQDINNNGEWDSGDLVFRRQPERVQIVEKDGERKIATKVNWEIEIDVDPAEMFAPETPAMLSQRLAEQESRRLKVIENKKRGL